MRKNEAIRNELIELNSQLAGFEPVNVFAIPDGYFESLPGSLLLQVTVDLHAENFSAPPPRYFEDFPSRVLKRIREEESNESKRVLDSISRRNVFTVPAEYFEQVAGEIMHKTREVSETKVIRLAPRFSVSRYAAAACVAVLMGIAIFNGLNGKVDSIAGAETSPALMAEASGILKAGDLDEQIGSLPDDVIVSYLKSTGEDVDAALVASLSNDAALPAVEDYFINEQTLENLLSELNIRGKAAN